ncbi:MAG: hypothetical protein K8R18_09425 [Parvibaculum sp.]|uniref:hypothetical protein n=1 Tax=Parvibaculum sp. TaxID=2024848 RepID=UPI0025EEE1A8|nr:hypothetical protein [Parvibaculum sp.]MCE9649828.1 hypothetical protein [Parvibaculum sp.]
MPKQKNEGEGNRTAAKEYNKGVQDFVKSGRVDEAAKSAERAVEGSEHDELEAAERKGKSHAKEFDPEEERDYSKPD